MRRQFFGWITAAAVAASLVSGCGGGGGDASSFNLPVLPGSTENEKVMEYNLKNFDGETDKAWVVASTVGSNEMDTTMQDISAEASSQYINSKAENSSVLAKDAKTEGTFVDPCGTYGTLDELKVSLGKALAKGAKLNLKPASVSARFDGRPANYRTTLYSPLGDGEQMDVVKVLDDSQTLHCNILSYADVTRNEEGGVTKVEVLVTASIAKMLANAFDYQNPFDATQPNAIGIYDRVSGLLGHEWRYSPMGGRDGDSRVNIVFCRNEQMGGEGVLGLVRFADPFDSSLAPTSNMGEYIYINYDALNGGDEIANNQSILGTMAHEYTHLVQLNAKLIEDGAFSNFTGASQETLNTIVYNTVERRTILEGFAETSSTLAGFGVCHAQESGVGAEAVSYDAINKYLHGDSILTEGAHGVTTFPESFFLPFYNTNSDPYGMGNLFGLHVIQFYGIDKFVELVDSPYVGMENLEKTLGADTDVVLHRYDLALSLDSLVNAPSEYTIPYINLGGSNYYRAFLGSAVSSHELKGLQDMAFAKVAVGANDPMETSFLPWSNCFLQMFCPALADVSFKVTVPKNANVNLIYESPDGVFNTLY